MGELQAVLRHCGAGRLEQTEVFEAKAFVHRFLSVKNLILNVSSVVWRRDALLRALTACEADLADFRMAGDWRLYLEALALPGAKVGYEAEPLNVHRRHATSVTHALDARPACGRDRALPRGRSAGFCAAGAGVWNQAAYARRSCTAIGCRDAKNRKRWRAGLRTA